MGLDANKDGKIELSELNKEGTESVALETLIKRYDLDVDSMLDPSEFPEFLDTVLQQKKTRNSSNLT